MLTIPNSDPVKLLADIKAAIQAGNIKTWKVDKDGDFSHTDRQLADRGFYLRPATDTAELRFRTLFTDKVTDKTERRFAYAYLHGHMTAMIVTHFASRVIASKSIMTTANPTASDSAI